ncbi:hypothetical protein BHM03_00055259 [Ensete ventricosum]|nr:hypothetical protein BHM03_00055259 [Ensete ventricosum]
MDSRSEYNDTAEAGLPYCFNAYIYLREPDKSEDKAKWSKEQGSDDESGGAQLPKSKASVRKEMDSEECHSAAEADLPIAKKGMQMQVLVVKGAEEVENAKGNSKYQDRAEGQRP